MYACPERAPHRVRAFLLYAAGGRFNRRLCTVAVRLPVHGVRRGAQVAPRMSRTVPNFLEAGRWTGYLFLRPRDARSTTLFPSLQSV